MANPFPSNGLAAVQSKRRSQLPPPRVYGNGHRSNVGRTDGPGSPANGAKTDGEPAPKVGKMLPDVHQTTTTTTNATRSAIPSGLASKRPKVAANLLRPPPSQAYLSHHNQLPHNRQGSPDEGDHWRGLIGSRVQVGGEKLGTLLFYGPTQFAEGIWCGVRLEEPVGKNNGTVHGVRYFTCEPDCGIFAPPHKIGLLPPPSPTEPLSMSSHPSSSVVKCPARSSNGQASSLPAHSPLSGRHRLPRSGSLDELPTPVESHAINDMSYVISCVPDGGATNLASMQTFLWSPTNPAADTFTVDDHDNFDSPGGHSQASAINNYTFQLPTSDANGTVVLDAAPITPPDLRQVSTCWTGASGYAEVSVISDDPTDDDYSAADDCVAHAGGRQGSLDLDESLGILTPDQMRDFTVAPDADLLQTPSDEGIQELVEDEVADSVRVYPPSQHQAAKDELYLPLRQQHPHEARPYEHSDSGTLTRETTETPASFTPDVGSYTGEWQLWTPVPGHPRATEHGIRSEETPACRTNMSHLDMFDSTDRPMVGNNPDRLKDCVPSPSSVAPVATLLSAILTTKTHAVPSEQGIELEIGATGVANWRTNNLGNGHLKRTLQDSKMNDFDLDVGPTDAPVTEEALTNIEDAARLPPHEQYQQCSPEVQPHDHSSSGSITKEGTETPESSMPGIVGGTEEWKLWTPLPGLPGPTERGIRSEDTPVCHTNMSHFDIFDSTDRPMVGSNTNRLADSVPSPSSVAPAVTLLSSILAAKTPAISSEQGIELGIGASGGVNWRTNKNLDDNHLNGSNSLGMPKDSKMDDFDLNIRPSGLHIKGDAFIDVVEEVAQSSPSSDRKLKPPVSDVASANQIVDYLSDAAATCMKTPSDNADAALTSLDAVATTCSAVAGSDTTEVLDLFRPVTANPLHSLDIDIPEVLVAIAGNQPNDEPEVFNVIMTDQSDGADTNVFQSSEVMIKPEVPDLVLKMISNATGESEPPTDPMSHEMVPLNEDLTDINVSAIAPMKSTPFAKFFLEEGLDEKLRLLLPAQKTSTPVMHSTGGVHDILSRKIQRLIGNDSPGNSATLAASFDKKSLRSEHLDFNESCISMTSADIESFTSILAKVDDPCATMSGVGFELSKLYESVHPVAPTTLTDVSISEKHELNVLAVTNIVANVTTTTNIPASDDVAVLDDCILHFVAEAVSDKTEAGGSGGAGSGMAASITSIETGYQGDAECDMQSEMGTNAANTPIDDGSSKEFKDIGRHTKGGPDPGSDSDFYSDMGASWTESELDGDERGAGNGNGMVKGRGARVIDGRLYYRSGSCSKDADVSSLSNESLSAEERHRAATVTATEQGGHKAIHIAAPDMPDGLDISGSALSESAAVPDSDDTTTRCGQQETNVVPASELSFTGDKTVQQEDESRMGNVVESRGDSGNSFDCTNATLKAVPDVGDVGDIGKANGAVVADLCSPNAPVDDTRHGLANGSPKPLSVTPAWNGKQRSPSVAKLTKSDKESTGKFTAVKGVAKVKLTGSPEKGNNGKKGTGSVSEPNPAAAKRMKTPKKNVMSKIKAMIEATSNKLTHKESPSVAAAGATAAPPSPRTPQSGNSDTAINSKPIRTPKKSRWEAVMSKIAAGQESEKGKNKREVISKVNSNLTPVRPTGAGAGTGTTTTTTRSPKPETGTIPKCRGMLAPRAVPKLGSKFSYKPESKVSVVSAASTGAKRRSTASVGGYSDLADVSINSRSEKSSSLMSNRGSKLPRSVSRPTTLSLGPPEADSRSSSQASMLSAGSRHSTLSQLTLASHTSTRPPQDASLASLCSNLSAPEDSRGAGTSVGKFSHAIAGRPGQKDGPKIATGAPGASRQSIVGHPPARASSVKYTGLDPKPGSGGPRNRLPASSSASRAAASTRPPPTAAPRRDRVVSTAQVVVRSRRAAPPPPTSSRPPSKGKEPMRPPKTSNGLVKSGPQPDLLHSSSVNRNNNIVTREVSRLEFLCEARTKELNYAKMQLKHCALGFDSLSVLVQYLTHELGAFSVPNLKAQLVQMQQKLSVANGQLDEEKITQTNLREELSKCQEDHKIAFDHIRTEMLDNLKQNEDRLNGIYHQEIERLTLSHQSENEELKLHYENLVASLTERHKESESTLRQNQADEMENFRTEHANEIKVLQQTYEDSLATASAERIKAEKIHEARIEELTIECGELTKKNISIHDILMNDGDSKLQAAHSYCEKLEKEVSSLKSVLEMQQSDLKESWSLKALMEKVTDELSTAKAKIKKLQAKNEDLQAMVAMKVENERELKNENLKLKEGFEKGAKLVKRVSMENEGLQWRLRQSREFPASFNVDGSLAEGSLSKSAQSSYFWDHEGILNLSTDSACSSQRSNVSPIKITGGATSNCNSQSSFSSRSSSPVVGTHNGLRPVRSTPFATNTPGSHHLGRPLSVPNHHSTARKGSPSSYQHTRGSPAPPTLSVSDDDESSSTDWAAPTSAVVLRNKSRRRAKVAPLSVSTFATNFTKSAPPSMSSSLIAPSETDGEPSLHHTEITSGGDVEQKTNEVNGESALSIGGGDSGGSDGHHYAPSQSASETFEEIWKSLQCRPFTPDSPSPDRFTLESPDDPGCDEADEDDEEENEHLVEELCYELTESHVSRSVIRVTGGGSSLHSECAIDSVTDLLTTSGSANECRSEDDGDACDYLPDERRTSLCDGDSIRPCNDFVEANDVVITSPSDLQDLTEEASGTSTSADEFLNTTTATTDSTVDPSVPFETTMLHSLTDVGCDGGSPGSSPKKTTTTLVIVYRKSRHSPDSSRGSSPAPQLTETPATSEGSDSPMTSSTDSSPRTSPPLGHSPDCEVDPSTSSQQPTNKALQMLENSLFAGIHSPRVSAGEAMMVLEGRSTSSSCSSREQPASLCDPAHALLKKALQDQLSSCGSSCCGGASGSSFRGSVESCATRGEPDSPPAGLSKPDTPESSQAILPTDSTNIDLSWSDEDLPSETEV